MAADSLASTNDRDPPEKLLVRTARVGAGVMNTLRVPGDPQMDKSGTWMDRELSAGSHKCLVTDGNEVEYIVDGKRAFERRRGA